MSRLSNNAKIANNKPFCKVCADAGKNDTAHFVRATPDPKSNVVCPTLLALECRYCFKNGHTVKYCTVLKRNEQERLRANRRTTVTTQAPTVTTIKTPVNKFALLDNEDEDEDEDEDEQLQQSITTTQTNNTTTQTNKNTWAAMATIAAPKAQPVYKPSTITTIAEQLHELPDEIDDATYVQTPSNYVQPAYFNTTQLYDAASYDGDEW